MNRLNMVTINCVCINRLVIEIIEVYKVICFNCNYSG